MSSLKNLTNAPSNNYPGDATWDSKQSSSGWLAMDGSIASQASNPVLYANVGLIKDGLNTWTARTSGTTSPIRSIIYGNSLYVYAGAGGVLATSTDAITWTARTSGTTSQIASLTYGNGIYVYAGVSGILATSTDAITWTARTSGTSFGISCLTYGNGLYVYGGQGAVLATSTDAITWTARQSNSTGLINTIIYGNSLYVYGSSNGFLATSTDAISWYGAISNSSATINGLIYANSSYLAAGTNGYAVSDDGINWNPIFVPGPVQGLSVTYGSGNTTYVISGQNGQILTAQPYTYNTASDFALPACLPNTLNYLTAPKTYAKNG
jgi:hypothetical protein